MDWLYLNITSVMTGIGFLIFGVSLVMRWWRGQKKLDAGLLGSLRNYKYSSRKTWVLAGSMILVLAFLTVGYWGPQWGEKTRVAEAEGVDVLFVLDVSKSMKAEDMTMEGRQVDRLSAAKQMMADFVSDNQGNRYGLVVFAGDAFVTTPLTFDLDAFMIFLSGVSSNDVAEQGTDLGIALEQSLSRFGENDDERGRVMVLVSDGGDEVENNYVSLAESAKDRDIRVVTVGIGNEEGVPIPEGEDAFGRKQLKTYQGEVVLTKLNDKPLRDIANITEGTYVQAESYKDMSKVQKAFEGLKTSKITRDESSILESRYQVFLAPAALLFGVFIMSLTVPRIKYESK